MPLQLTSEQTTEAIYSLKKYCMSELDFELSDLKAKLMLNYMLKEIVPLGYNQGVTDAEKFFRNKLEDLSATCFEPTLTYWQQKRR